MRVYFNSAAAGEVRAKWMESAKQSAEHSLTKDGECYNSLSASPDDHT
jgi:hypothetical protein